MGELLGVAGTDVPIAEIVKLVPPHMVRYWINCKSSSIRSHLQLGVGGYSFAVNNNGHLLYHPDLRPMVSDQLATNELMAWLIQAFGWFVTFSF